MSQADMSQAWPAALSRAQAETLDPTELFALLRGEPGHAPIDVAGQLAEWARTRYFVQGAQTVADPAWTTADNYRSLEDPGFWQPLRKVLTDTGQAGIATAVAAAYLRQVYGGADNNAGGKRGPHARRPRTVTLRGARRRLCGRSPVRTAARTQRRSRRREPQPLAAHSSRPAALLAQRLDWPLAGDRQRGDRAVGRGARTGFRRRPGHRLLLAVVGEHRPHDRCRRVGRADARYRNWRNHEPARQWHARRTRPRRPPARRRHHDRPDHPAKRQPGHRPGQQRRQLVGLPKKLGEQAGRTGPRRGRSRPRWPRRLRRIRGQRLQASRRHGRRGRAGKPASPGHSGRLHRPDRRGGQSLAVRPDRQFGS